MIFAVAARISKTKLDVISKALWIYDMQIEEAIA
jgi:hypothetical protein